MISLFNHHHEPPWPPWRLLCRLHGRRNRAVAAHALERAVLDVLGMAVELRVRNWRISA